MTSGRQTLHDIDNAVAQARANLERTSELASQMAEERAALGILPLPTSLEGALAQFTADPVLAAALHDSRAALVVRPRRLHPVGARSRLGLERVPEGKQARTTGLSA